MYLCFFLFFFCFVFFLGGGGLGEVLLLFVVVFCVCVCVFGCLFFFYQKEFDISCKLSPQETICRECQTTFKEK